MGKERNSQLGAMVYGGTDVEELALNEETFWSGSPHDNNSPEARLHLQEVRDLTLMGREEEGAGRPGSEDFRGCWRTPGAGCRDCDRPCFPAELAGSQRVGRHGMERG